MDNPITRLHLDTKLGPLPRKAWLGIAVVGVGGVMYYRHRQNMADVAGATDGTVAGATQNAAGDQVQTNGTATDAGTSPMSLYDPYTSGYGGGGTDVLLGTGGIVNASGRSDTPAAPVAAATVGSNPSAPGASNSAPHVTVNLPGSPPVRGTAEPTPKELRDTIAKAVREAMHNAKNGRQPTKRRVKPPPTTRKQNPPKKGNKPVVSGGAGI